VAVSGAVGGSTDPAVPAAKVPRAERLAQLGLKFTKGLPENIRDLVRARPTGFRFVLSDGKSDRAVPGLYLRVGADGDSVFWLQYRVKLGPGAGGRRQYRIGGVTLEAARREAKQILARVEAGGDPLSEKQAAKQERARAKASTLGAFLDDVYQPQVLAHLGDGKATEQRFRKVWKPLFSKPLTGIAETDVAAILADRKDEGIQAGTLHRDYAVLRAALRYAVKRKLLAAVPLGEKPGPIAGRKMRPNKRVRYLADEPGAKGEASERARFMKALGDERNLFVQTVATLALATGMRRANILELTDAKIHGDHILVPAPETKSGKDLPVFLNADAKRALAGWKLRGMKGELFPLARFGGTKLARERQVERGWGRLCRKAKVTDFHFHDARHDFASRMLRAGASLAMVRDALGHSSIAMTERYAHLERRDLRAAVQAVTLG
jgi:integrase